MEFVKNKTNLKLFVALLFYLSYHNAKQGHMVAGDSMQCFSMHTASPNIYLGN